jgi:hypothetical protein
MSRSEAVCIRLCTRHTRARRDACRTRLRLNPVEREFGQVGALLDVAKVKCYGVRTETSDDGTQRNHLVLPKGVEAPLAHVQTAPVKMAANRT